MKANLENDKFYLSLIEKGYLKVTKSGQAFNLVTGKEIGKGTDGYRKLSWLNPVTQKIVQIQLHRLVWAYFKGVLKDRNIQINHKDGIKANCRLSNLETVSSKENSEHARRNNLVFINTGDGKPNALWSDEEVQHYRKLFRQRKVRPTDIAREYSCSIATVSYMLNRKTYKHT